MNTRNKLYLFLGIACLIGLFWILLHIYFNAFQNTTNNITVCVFKNITTYPCPSCGTTRSVISIFQGKYFNALQINPIGFIISLIVIICPIWILFDIIFKKQSLFVYYKKTEKLIRTPRIYIPLIILISINWIWNVYKGL